jgi:hypothetical protein
MGREPQHPLGVRPFVSVSVRRRVSARLSSNLCATRRRPSRQGAWARRTANATPDGHTWRALPQHVAARPGDESLDRSRELVARTVGERTHALLLPDGRHRALARRREQALTRRTAVSSGKRAAPQIEASQATEASVGQQSEPGQRVLPGPSTRASRIRAPAARASPDIQREGALVGHGARPAATVMPGGSAVQDGEGRGGRCLAQRSSWAMSSRCASTAGKSVQSMSATVGLTSTGECSMIHTPGRAVPRRQ